MEKYEVFAEFLDPKKQNEYGLKDEFHAYTNSWWQMKKWVKQCMKKYDKVVVNIRVRTAIHIGGRSNGKSCISR